MTDCQTAPSLSLPQSEEQTVPEEQVLGQYIPLLYHYNMLQDEDRVGAFLAAINLLVRPGMHVLELGGGTGILSSFAAHCGATVSCVERNPELVSCARRFIADNGLSDRITVFHGDASSFVPHKPVDVVICEMLHVGLLREKQAQVISDFKRGYVRKYGSKLPIFIPEVSILMAQPVQQSFDFAGYYAPIPLFQAPLLHQPRTVELASLNPYANIAYNESIPMSFAVRQPFVVNIPGSCNAVRFVTQNILAIDMKRQQAITWANQCLVLPLESAVDVREGQELNLFFDYQAGGAIEQLASSLHVEPSTLAVQPSKMAA